MVFSSWVETTKPALGGLSFVRVGVSEVEVMAATAKPSHSALLQAAAFVAAIGEALFRKDWRPLAFRCTRVASFG
ncbi:hypothetical protein NP534_02905, partial [Pseudomonas sp. 39004]|uniref:hypothetical protein n=1 Tax=Pseudomonas sp. 39004 TaxID=2967213 RepID=UPI0023632249